MDKAEKHTFCLDIPIEECDVLVVGGGPAGIAAAVASSRQGASTILVERYGFVGGMATAGLVGPFMSCYDARGTQRVIGGIFSELVSRMILDNGALDPAHVPAGSGYTSFLVPAHHNCTPFDPEVMKYVAMDMLLEGGVDVRLHTRYVGVAVDRMHVQHVLAADKAGIRGIRATVYIDTTGDADVLASASPDGFWKGRAGDGRLQPATMFMRVGGVDDDRIEEWVRGHPGEHLFASLVEEAQSAGTWPSGADRNFVGLYRQPRAGEWRVNTSRIAGIDGTSPEQMTKAEIEGRRQTRDLLKFFRKYCPGMGASYLLDTAPQVGIRETRRIKGLYCLTEDDVRTARRFDTAIARFAFFMDVHNPSGRGQEGVDKPSLNGGGWRLLQDGDFFDVPFGCLVPEGIDNLLVGGRSISCDRMANGAVRVMPICFATGQAAGTAAAISAKEEIPPSKVDVQELRRRLLEAECIV